MSNKKLLSNLNNFFTNKKKYLIAFIAFIAFIILSIIVLIWIELAVGIFGTKWAGT